MSQKYEFRCPVCGEIANSWGQLNREVRCIGCWMSEVSRLREMLREGSPQSTRSFLRLLGQALSRL